ncbi:MAG: ATP-binding protein [Flavisolibacter sp.]|nr:ATP-binding protein [Flavisolibacter sp.]
MQKVPDFAQSNVQMEELLVKSAFLVLRVHTGFKRYLYRQINWNNRLIAIIGPRGTGKTTLLLQKLHELDKSPTVAAYFSLDDLYFTTNSLVATAEDFYRKGGKHLFLDEVHKYPGWARHIKNLYDFYPDLQIVFTGSSIINIAREEVDLSRRARMYELQGLSYREYLAYTGVLQTEPFQLEELLTTNYPWQKKFPAGFLPLQHFTDYLTYGYYPFFTEDPEGFPLRIQQLVRLIVEYDMAELNDFDIRNAKKLLQLLYILSANVPFKPNLSSLSEKSNIHRNSINNYLLFLEQARLIRLLYPSGISVSVLQKPEKIYLDNTNLAHALSQQHPDKGNLRETFFLNQVSSLHHVSYPQKGDFMVNEKWVFEVGGKTKSGSQVKEVPNSFIVQDDVAFPVGDVLPLWLFGFLY